MRVSAYLNAKQYQAFKSKAEQLSISEYELAKRGILLTISPQDTWKIKLFIAFKEAYDIFDNAP